MASRALGALTIAALLSLPLLGACNLITGAEGLEIGDGGAGGQGTTDAQGGQAATGAGAGTTTGAGAGPTTGAGAGTTTGSGAGGDTTTGSGAGGDPATTGSGTGGGATTTTTTTGSGGPSCGDGACNGGETCASCPGDCGACCGNGACDNGEACDTCPADCGMCNPCGNGACDSGETCDTCASDCGACPVCKGAGDATTGLDSEEQAFLVLINNYRAMNGLGPLDACTSLNRAAQGHSEDMRDQNYFSHTGLDGSSPWGRSCDACYALGCGPMTAMGENIAAGNSTAQATFDQWKASPPHNANMLGVSFKVIGIGRASGGGMYGVYWTNVFGGDTEASCN